MDTIASPDGTCLPVVAIQTRTTKLENNESAFVEPPCPILKLPNEILSCIIVIVFCPTNDNTDSTDSTLRKCMLAHLIPLHICRRFRAVAFETQSLFTFLANVDSMPYYIERALHQGWEAPLTVVVTRAAMSTSAFLPTILEHCRRIRTLKLIDVRWGPNNSDFESTVHELELGGAPSCQQFSMLEELTVEYKRFNDLPRFLEHWAMPKLRRLVVKNSIPRVVVTKMGSVFSSSLRSLHLEFDFVRWPMFDGFETLALMKFLDGRENLEHLSLVVDCAFRGAFPSPSESATLPAVTTFEIGTGKRTNRALLFSLLQTLRIPRLTTLTLSIAHLATDHDLMLTINGILLSNKSFGLVHNLELSLPSIKYLELLDLASIGLLGGSLKRVTVNVDGEHAKSFKIDGPSQGGERIITEEVSCS
ncbi:hypothetical protein SCHPADRAFT_909057 [Schizopora paradoxa]|uniref:F-box domain-containing protein n=1 Tax=Schizopora paradoxa TaxID=27342 RepID=A0A0H2R7Y4_9AGAM|nr:hypothetical protein SCHPADRAFT_909057 [Schizopora paradoxa]